MFNRYFVTLGDLAGVPMGTYLSNVVSTSVRLRKWLTQLPLSAKNIMTSITNTGEKTDESLCMVDQVFSEFLTYNYMKQE